MRILSFFLLCLSLSLYTMTHSEVAYSDAFGGVFRFQLKLAEQGNSEAQYKVGEMYENGKGTHKSELKAKTWYEKAAAQKHKKASYKLLNLEIKNNGLNDSSKSRLGLLRQQAAAGDADAQYFLGQMYAEGIGVPKSLDNALTWLNKATFNGVPEAEHEAIAVEEELARIKARESNKRASALEASRLKKQEEEKKRALKKKEADKKRKAAAAKRKSDKANLENKRAAEERRRKEKERAALAAEKNKQEKQKAAAAAKAEKAKQDNSKKSSNSSFSSDPCKSKSARFLSTCR